MSEVSLSVDSVNVVVVNESGMDPVCVKYVSFVKDLLSEHLQFCKDLLVLPIHLQFYLVQNTYGKFVICTASLVFNKDLTDFVTGTMHEKLYGKYFYTNNGEETESVIRALVKNTVSGFTKRTGEIEFKLDRINKITALFDNVQLNMSRKNREKLSEVLPAKEIEKKSKLLYDLLSQEFSL